MARENRADWNAELREKVDADELQAEQAQIEQCYKSLRFAQQIRFNSLACMKACGGNVDFPFSVNQISLMHNSKCFANCLNVRLEKGPFLHELGDVPEDSIPKKFLWHQGVETASE
jgi:hypothetical protein